LTAFCGVTAHFCDHNGTYRSFLLAILEHTTSHAGTDISQTLQQIIRHFAIEDNLGYFQCDNASNNDTCI
jgi:hypothetical protein